MALYCIEVCRLGNSCYLTEWIEICELNLSIVPWTELNFMFFGYRLATLDLSIYQSKYSGMTLYVD